MFGTANKDNPFAGSDPFATQPMREDVDNFESVDINAPGSTAAPLSAFPGTGGSPFSNGPAGASGTVNPVANGVAVSGKNRERELAAREKALAKRERELEERERALGDAGVNVKRKNWPRFRPVMRYSIAEDVPPGRQRLVRLGYGAWIVMATGFCWNWIVVLIMFIAGHKKLSDWLFASLICLPGLPLSWWLWHLNLYKGAIRDTGFRWWWFFIWAALQPVLCGWVAVAPPVVGNWAAGGFTMIDQFSKGDSASIVFAIFSIVNMVFWAVALLGGTTVTSMAMKTFRNSQASLGGDVQMAAGKSARKEAKRQMFGSEARSAAPSSNAFGSDAPRYQV